MIGQVQGLQEVFMADLVMDRVKGDLGDVNRQVRLPFLTSKVVMRHWVAV